MNNTEKEIPVAATTRDLVNCGLCTYVSEQDQDSSTENILENQEEFEEKNDISVINANDLLNLRFNEREYLIEPILLHPSSTMIYADPGVGKTFFGIFLSICMGNKQDIYEWTTGSPKKILYVDGEMSGPIMQERVRKLLNGLNLIDSKSNLNLQFCLYGYPETQPHIDFGNNQDRFNFTCKFLLDKIDVLIIDNLSSLVDLDENDNTAWKPFNQWCQFLRKHGISVIIMHHSNKGKTDRGASNKLDALDNVIYLTESNGVITGKFIKHRAIPADLAKPFTFKIVDLNKNSIGLEFFVSNNANSSHDNYKTPCIKLLNYLNTNNKLSYRELETISGISKTAIGKYLKQEKKSTEEN